MMPQSRAKTFGESAREPGSAASDRACPEACSRLPDQLSVLEHVDVDPVGVGIHDPVLADAVAP